MATTTTYALHVDWNNDGDFGDTGEVITDRVMSVKFERGRDTTSQLTGRSIAGRLTAILNNQSNDYSPFNTSSPLTGLLLPGRPVRFVIGSASSFTYTFPFDFTDTALWSGFLESIKPTVITGQMRTVELVAVGALAMINRKKVQVGTQTNQRTDQLIGTILDSAGWPAGDRDLEVGHTTVKSYWNSGGSALAAIREVEETEAGFIYEKRDGSIKFEDRTFRMTDGKATTSFLTLSDHSSTSYPYESIRQLDPLPSIFNDFRANVRIVSTGSIATLWTHPETGSDSPSIKAGESNSYYAQYPPPTEGVFASAIAGQVAVAAWTTPAATTDFTVNAAADGSGTNLTSSINVAVAKLSNSMKITLTNTSSTDGVITLLKARGTTVISSDPVLMVAEDATSQTAYLKRTYPNFPQWLPSSQEAQQWVNARLSIFKDPLPQLTIGWTATKNANTLAAALDLDVSMRVTVVAENNAGLGIDEDFFVEAIRHSISRGNTLHRVSMDLSPVSASSGFFSLGVSTLGQNTRLFY